METTHDASPGYGVAAFRKRPTAQATVPGSSKQGIADACDETHVGDDEDPCRRRSR